MVDCINFLYSLFSLVDQLLSLRRNFDIAYRETDSAPGGVLVAESFHLIEEMDSLLVTTCGEAFCNECLETFLIHWIVSIAEWLRKNLVEEQSSHRRFDTITSQHLGFGWRWCLVDG